MEAANLARELAVLEPAAAASPDRVRVVHAPGRVNLIGEHTDYNGGFVLPVAIDLGISIAFVPTDDRRVELTLLADGRRAVIDLDALSDPHAGDAGRQPDGTWADYVAGTAWALAETGVAIRGFRGLLASDLPIGAGLSSSAALELAVAWALGGGAAPIVDRLALARACQRAENAYVGVPCGLMDQFAVAFGVAGSALLLDCRSFEHRVVAIPASVELLVCDSGVERRLRGSEYEDRRAECDRAVEALRAVDPSIRSLRDVQLPMLEAERDRLDAVALRRARHVVTENTRVGEAVAVLESGDVAALAPIFAAGHASLRDDFEVSTPELDRLVEVAVEAPGCLGARLTGAGFGGCTINLVARGAVDAFVEHVMTGYRTPAGAPPRVWPVQASAGAGVIWPAA